MDSCVATVRGLVNQKEFILGGQLENMSKTFAESDHYSRIVLYDYAPPV